MQANKSANINWVKDIYIEQNFDVLNDSVFLLKRDYIMSDFSIGKKDKAKGVYGKRTTMYKGYEFDNDKGEEFYNKEIDIYDEEIYAKADEYWSENRQEKLNKEAKEYDLDAEINALLAEASSNLPDEKSDDNLPVFQLDKETDMLLVNAFQELNINPEEDTVNESLKDKLFKELEKGYFKSRILLAERSEHARPKEYTSIY